MTDFDYNYWAAVTIDGAVYGCVYGLLGLCLVVIFRANRMFNFSLTQMATLLILFMTLLIAKEYNLGGVVVFGIVIAFCLGALLHLGIMRYALEKKNSGHTQNSSESLLTMGILAILDGMSNYLFTDEAANFPSLIKDGVVEIFKLNISYQSLAVLGVSSIVVLLIFLFFNYSKMGLKMEAVAENMMAARLRGIRASNVLSFAWGSTTALSVMAGTMIAPIIFVSPTMFAYIFSYSLIAVVIGGLESPLGAVVGGIIIGIIESVSAQFDFIGSDQKFIPVFIFLLVMLIIKPRGLWGRAEGRRV